MNVHTKVDHPDIEDGIFYPCSDGEPMAETQFHILTIRWLLQALEDYFANRSDVFVAGNIFWYWEQGNPRACRSRGRDTCVRQGPETSPRNFGTSREAAATGLRAHVRMATPRGSRTWARRSTAQTLRRPSSCARSSRGRTLDSAARPFASRLW